MADPKAAAPKKRTYTKKTEEEKEAAAAEREAKKAAAASVSVPDILTVSLTSIVLRKFDGSTLTLQNAKGKKLVFKARGEDKRKMLDAMKKALQSIAEPAADEKETEADWG